MSTVCLLRVEKTFHPAGYSLLHVLNIYGWSVLVFFENIKQISIIIEQKLADQCNLPSCYYHSSQFSVGDTSLITAVLLKTFENVCSFAR